MALNIGAPKIDISFASGRGTILVDGFPVPGVSEASFTIRAGELGRVQLTILGDIAMTADEMDVVASLVNAPEPESSRDLLPGVPLTDAA